MLFSHEPHMLQRGTFSFISLGDRCQWMTPHPSIVHEIKILFASTSSGPFIICFHGQRITSQSHWYMDTCFILITSDWFKPKLQKVVDCGFCLFVAVVVYYNCQNSPTSTAICHVGILGCIIQKTHISKF